jgi:hypothetical protein
VCGNSLAASWYCCLLPDMVVLAVSIALWLLRARRTGDDATLRTPCASCCGSGTPLGTSQCHS